MKAAVFDGKLRFVTDRPRPAPGRGEALLRVLMAGICNTDLEILKGYMDFRGVLGHEFVGVVEEAPGSEGLAGRRVVGEINLACGRCGRCLGGLKTHCTERAVLGILRKDGAMAEYATLPVENLHEVPEGVSDEEAVFTEPLAAAFEVMEQVHIRPSDRVLVMGDGKLGLLISLALGLSRADATLLGRHENKLSIARAQGVRTALFDSFKAEKDFDVVVEATGRAGGLEAALSFVRPRGTVVLKSTVAQGRAMNLSPLVVSEVTVVGSRCGPFDPALRALSGRLLDVRPLITGTYGFERAGEAFEKAEEKGSVKILLDFRG